MSLGNIIRRALMATSLIGVGAIVGAGTLAYTAWSSGRVALVNKHDYTAAKEIDGKAADCRLTQFDTVNGQAIVVEGRTRSSQFTGMNGGSLLMVGYAGDQVIYVNYEQWGARINHFGHSYERQNWSFPISATCSDTADSRHLITARNLIMR